MRGAGEEVGAPGTVSYPVPYAASMDPTPEAVFGWNPFATFGTGKAPNVVQPLPQWAKSNHEIMQLTDLYQQQLAELVAAHSLLMDDQESFAAMLGPLLNKDGSFSRPPDENMLLIKRGLDLRLLEFEEDCRRIQQTERRLQRKIDDCTLTYETSLIEARGYAEMRLIEQIQHQQKLIEYQQHELDELRFQRDLYSDETLRLRQLCRFGDFRHPDHKGLSGTTVERIPIPSPRTLHKEYSGARPPFAWMRNIRHSRRPKRDRESTSARRSAARQRPPAASAQADQPFTPTFVKSQDAPRSREPSQPAPRADRSGFLGMLSPMFGGTQKPDDHKADDAKSHLSSPAPSERESITPVTLKERSVTPQHQVNGLSALASFASPDEDQPQQDASLTLSSLPPGKPSRSTTLDIQEIAAEPSPSEYGTPGYLSQSPSPTSSVPFGDTAKRRSSGAGLAVGTRRYSRSSSRQSISQRSSVMLDSPARRRSIASPQPTTLSRLTSESKHAPLSREVASKFLDL